MENEQSLTSEPEYQKKRDKGDNRKRLALILLFLLFSFVCLLCSSQSALWFVVRDRMLGSMRSAQQADYGPGVPIIFSRLDRDRLIAELFADEQAIIGGGGIVSGPAIAQLPKVTPKAAPSPIPILPTPTPEPTQTPTPVPTPTPIPQSSAPTSPPQSAPTQSPATQPPATQPPTVEPPPPTVEPPPPTVEPPPPTTEPPPPPPPPPDDGGDGGSNPPNNSPTAANDTASTTENTAVNIAVLANDSDPDGDTLTIISVGTPSNGTAIIVGNSILYTPALNFTGVDTFSYTISDGSVNASATVTVTVNPGNDPPIARDDTATTNEDTGVIITVLSNDTDPDGDPLSVISTNTTTGTAVINVPPPTYTVTYTPPLNFNGVITFGYTISDGSLTDSAVVTVTVGAVNDPPTTVDDTAATNQDTSVNIPVLANDSDIDGTLVTNTLTISTPPISGTAVANTITGIVTYTPTLGISGIDIFVYQICDDGAACSTATVTVTITDTTPAAPTNLQAAAGDGQISLGWIHNPPADLIGYNIYRSDGVLPFTLISTTLVITRYVDQPLVNGTTYTYTVTAIDAGSNESAPSNTASATPGAIITYTTNVTCSGNVVNCASAGGSPNTSIAEIMDSTGIITFDFGAGEGILDGPSWDMVFYEFFDGPDVLMDYVTIELSADGTTWYTVFEWDGDTGAAVDIQGTSVDLAASDGELENESIPSDQFYPQFMLGTMDSGVAIDIGAVQNSPPGGQKYRYVRISYPPGGTDIGQVAAVERLN